MSMVHRYNHIHFFKSRLLELHPRILIICFHTLVSSAILVCSITTLICLWMSYSNELRIKHQFLNHALQNKAYYFSLWVVAMEYIGFMLYSAVDVLDICGKQSTRLKKIRDALRELANHILFGISFPLSPVISILFWGLYLWNREVIYPRIVDDIIPPFMNHMMHTFPVPAAILYMFTDIRTEPPKAKTFVMMIAFITVYSSVLFTVRKRGGYWVYPILEILSPSQLTITLMFALISSLVFFWIGYHVYSKIKELRSHALKELEKIKSSRHMKVKIS